MERCNACQSQLLEYLYDVLDTEERRVLQEHLDGCAACQAALVKARGQRELLATAARMAFADVRFTAPTATPAAEPTPALVLPLPAPARRAERHGIRWAVAAALLLAVGGMGGTGLWFWRDYASARDAVARQMAVFAQASADQTRNVAAEPKLMQERQEKTNAVERAIQERGLNLQVTGPAAVQPGAPTAYSVSTTDLNGQPVVAEVTARVVDEKGQRGEPIVAKSENGVARIVLPADLPVKPDSQLALVFAAQRAGGQAVELSEKVPLAAPVYLTHLTTDKPMYQPGETVRFRSLTLDRFSLKPATEEFRFSYVVNTPTGEERQILQAGNGLVRGEEAGSAAFVGADGKPVRGVGAGELALEPEAPGGEYVLTVREEQNRFPPQQRKFIVNRYQKPRLDKELDFNRTTFGPGDEVQAQCKAVRAGGAGPVKDRPVTVTVQIDGQSYGADGKPSAQPLAFKTDGEGRVSVRFKLPAAIERGEATVAVQFDDGGGVETLVKPIPILLKKLRVEFYPEGGDLIAGLANRVYFQALTPLGKPADCKGRLLEDGKPTDVVVETTHDDKEPGVNHGTGRFEFTPKARTKYEVQIESPAGISQRFALPAAEEDGVVLRTPDAVVAAGGAVPVVVESTKPRTLLVGLYCRGRLLDSKRLQPGETKAALEPTAGTGGVCRVTVFEERETKGNRRDLKPVAERLVYRQPKERLRLAFSPDKSSYVPGQKVKLGVAAFDENDKNAPALVMLAVVDKSVLTLADEKTARAMPTHFLLTTEVRRPEDLEYADFLIGSNPKAPLALDLLLGTQGWRRFAEQDPAKFRKEQKDEAERLLVTIGQTSAVTTDFAQAERARVDAEYDAKLGQLLQERRELIEKTDAAKADAGYLAAVAQVARYKELGGQLGRWWPPVGAAVLAVAGVVFLTLGVVRFRKQAVPYFGMAAVCSVAVVIVLVSMQTLTQMDGNRQMVATGPGNMAPRGMLKDRARPLEEAAVMERMQVEKAEEFAVPGRFAAPPAAPAAPHAMAPMRALGGKGGGFNGGFVDRVIPMNAKRPMDRLGMAKPGGGPMAPNAALRKGRAAGDMKADQAKVMEGRGWRDNAPGDHKRRGGLMADMFEPAEAPAELMLPAMVVREYAHQHTHGNNTALRSDFTETIYWHPVLVLPGGKAEVSFDLSDSVTSFQATAFAHTLDGRLDAGSQVLDSRLPFTLQPKTPIEVTSSDEIEVPLAVANNTGEARTVQVELKEHFGLDRVRGEEVERFDVKAGPPVRRSYRFKPTLKEGEAVLTFQGKADEFAADAVRATIKVAPEGFPIVGQRSDVLEGGAAVAKIDLPQTWVKGTLKVNAQVFPSTLADLQKGLDGLLREPGGCFEQTSTSNYPNLLILDYLKESDQSKPEVERRARELLTKGYAMLTSFECLDTPTTKRRGYEWFGGTAPAHEALTAYGLMEFRDMARVHDVDPAMLKRTQEYLLSQRDGKGGFKRNPRALDSFGAAPPDITDAYIVWSLTEGGKDDDVTTELNALAAKAKESKDPYFLALVANSLINRARTADGTELLKKVAAAQQADGHLDAERTSITGSGGRDLQIETTALAILGWLKANPGEFAAATQKAVQWIGQQRGGYGGFGSTQSTILTLKALIAFTKAHKRTAEAGEVRLLVGDREIKKLAFPAGASETLALDVPDAETLLKPGINSVRVEITGKNFFPYTLAWSYNTLQPVSAEGCPVRLATKLAKADLKEGEAVRLTVAVENATDKGQGMAVAVVGLPGGLTVPEDLKQLKLHARLPEDGSRPLVSAFEIRGRELVLYWRDLAPKQKIEVPVDLIARVPGAYSGPASRAYLYYNADKKHWVEPLKVGIGAKE